MALITIQTTFLDSEFLQLEFAKYSTHKNLHKICFSVLVTCNIFGNVLQ